MRQVPPVQAAANLKFRELAAVYCYLKLNRPDLAEM